MKFLRNNWYNLGLLFFVIMAFWLIFWGDTLNTLQKILLASLLALPIHQYEEYALPGGGPVVINLAIYSHHDNFRHYPGNWQSCMVVNLSAYVFYLLALFLPDLIWLGMATMFFNLMQLLGHGIKMNLALKTWYNPGMATSILLLTPISVYYIWYVVNHSLIVGFDWVLAVAAFLIIAILTVILPVQGMKNENSPYDVPEWQVEQFYKVKNFASFNKER